MDLLGERYGVERILGERHATTTFLARARATGELCVLKRLSTAKAYALRGAVVSWSGAEGEKHVELFKREAAVLQGLSCPGIPRLIEHFTEQTSNDIFFYLV